MKDLIYLFPFFCLLLSIGACTRFRTETDEAYRRISGPRETVETANGTVEYVRGGRGYPVLLVHGAGGGFDQARLMGETMLGDEFSWFAPSRFGYLGSEIPADPSPEKQAESLIRLMDAEGIERFGVIALSAGGRTGLQLALDYPDRISSLILISARTRNLPEADGSEKFFTWIFKRDSTYWMVGHLFRNKLLTQCGISKEVLKAMSIGTRENADRFVRSMYPAEPRLPGIIFDIQTGIGPEQVPVEKITVPTLVIHAQDDTLISYDHALFSSQNIPGAELASFPRGGHALFFVDQERVSERIGSFLRSEKARHDG